MFGMLVISVNSIYIPGCLLVVSFTRPRVFSSPCYLITHKFKGGGTFSPPDQLPFVLCFITLRTYQRHPSASVIPNGNAMLLIMTYSGSSWTVNI